MTDQAALTKALTDFARLLVHDYQPSDALHDLIDGVTDVLGVSGAGVSLVDGERLAFATAISDAVGTLERVQEDTQKGPCVDAHRSGHEVLVADLSDDSERWPALSRAATRVGMVAVAGIPMHLNGTRLGVLNLYHASRRDWAVDEIATARLMAQTATGYLANAARRNGTRTAMPIEAASSVIRQIFAVSLSLASCVELADGLVADRLTMAIDDLDAIVAGLRRTSMHQLAHHADNPAAVSRQETVTPDLNALTAPLGAIAGWADELSRSATTDGPELIHLLDAVHSVHRAMVSLASEPLSLRPARPLPESRTSEPPA